MEPGTLVLHYRLGQRLGAGGMGEVFLAHDTRLDRRVAIKFLRGPADEAHRKRLLREARAAAALDHPDIGAIYDVASDPTVGDFLVMQYLEGETLATQLKRGPLTPSRALEVATRIAGALGAAHARGLVHRDLKPQNVIITPAGDVKLLDFGIAKRLPDTPEAVAAETTSDWIRPGAVIGTPGYMSPEQIRAAPVDGRTDLFALGCVLYECLTGRRAFSGATAADVSAQVLNVEPSPPSQHCSALTHAHDALCARLMSKSLEARFQSANEVLDALRAISSASDRGRGARPSWLGRMAMAAVAGIGIVAFVFLWKTSLPKPPPEVARWYEDGVEAIRDGRYVAARSLLLEAVGRFSDFPQAYSRLAEAHSELDEESQAKTALLNVDELVRKLGEPPSEDRLRIDAIRAFVLRDYPTSIARYTRLAELRPNDAGRWVDVARAEEAAALRTAATAHYERAVSLDKDYAAAHLRLGSLRGQAGRTEDGLESLDVAGRLYRARGQTEGESEALLRKGLLLTPVGRFKEARDVLSRVMAMTQDPQLLHQRVRAMFDLGRLDAVTGSIDKAVTMGRDGIKAAADAGLWGYAALGQVDLSNTYLFANDVDQANIELSRAVALAVEHGARKTEIRARLVQASLRVQHQKPAEAIALLEEPLKFIRAQQFLRFEADAKAILSRAHEDLEQYDAARTLSTEVLAFARSIDDQLQIATALDLIASQLTKQGRLPEALTLREERESIDRALGIDGSLTYDLINHAELLVRLGRGAESEVLLQEFDAKVAAGVRLFVNRQNRTAMVRALRAATEGRFQDVLRFAQHCDSLTPKPDSTTRYVGILADYARAMMGTRKTAAVTTSPDVPDVSSASARESRYWEAQAHLARREYKLALEIAHAAWSASGAQGNVEQRWRLAAIASLAAQHLKPSELPQGISTPARTATDIQELSARWTGAAASYFARKDLVALRQPLS